MDVEYGGGRTVPRVAVTSFDEGVLYYSDFCLRYEDWIETKLTASTEQEQPNNFAQSNQRFDQESNSDDDDDMSDSVKDEIEKAEHPEYFEDFMGEEK